MADVLGPEPASSQEGASTPSVGITTNGGDSLVDTSPASTPVAPAVTSAPIISAEEEAELDKELEELSPFKLLKESPGQAQKIPVQSPEVSPSPVNTAPATLPLVDPDQSTFILPDQSIVSVASTPPTPVAPAPKPAPTPVTPPVSPAAPLPAPKPAPAVPVVQPIMKLPQTVLPEKEPVQSVAKPLSSQPVAQVQSNPVLPRSSQKRKSPLPILIGVVVVLILIGGGSFVMASRGTRLPILYTAITGLPVTGLEVAAKSKTWVASQSSYELSSSTSIAQASAADDSTRPEPTTSPTATVSTNPSDGDDVGLPDTSGLNTDTGGESSSFYAISADEKAKEVSGTVSASSPVRYDLASNEVVGKTTFKIDGGSEVPVYFKYAATDDTWYFNLLHSSNPALAKVPSSSVEQTLLYGALRPLSLADLFAALQAEQAYQSLDGAVRYQYTINTSVLSDYLPQGASWKNASAVVDMKHTTAEPIGARVKGVFTYEGTEYSFDQQINTAQWSKELTSSDSDLAGIAAEIEADDLKEFNGGQLVDALGIDIETVPHTLPDSELNPVVETITPTGESITTKGSEISKVPPLPVQPASVIAKTRDEQRLADLSVLQSALEAYKTSTGSYPSTNGEIQQTGSSSTLLTALVPTYLTALPVDPQSATYWYEYKSDGSTFVIRSFAEDASSISARKGTSFSYYQVTGN